ncbi:unnamed protein product [Mycena citricolor]|uniref:HMG box domain-containing protein n=1 Tax=Mycena citricolor TaxID=2018698 RepID=A0AAD2JYD8_9AGAR|nr:unnamed protein product [Mycena citricolor]
MPAERSRYSRRSQADGDGIVWTLPVEPVGESGIGFTPNLTEDAFTDVPPLVDIPDLPSPIETTFILSDDIVCRQTSQPRQRNMHARKKSDNHVPRPPNAFILFRSSFIKSQRVSTEVETNHSTLSKIIGMTWKNMSDEEREIWRQKAMDAVAEHKRNFPSYAFRPKQSKAVRGQKGDGGGSPSKGKRKVREFHQDAARCEKIAELLVEGKKGAELDQAIKEYDKHHVPTFQTRFEVPITARSYRRSSSVPAPHSDDALPFLAPQPAVVHHPRRRSSSVGAVPRATDLKGSLAPPAVSATSDSTFHIAVESKMEPLNLDFSSFSFSNVSQPDPSFRYDPLSMPVSPSSNADSPGFNHNVCLEPTSPGVGSLDVSAYIAHEWQMHGNSSHSFGGYQAPEYPSYTFPSPNYLPTAASDYLTTSISDPAFCAGFKNLAFDNPLYLEAIPGLAQLEADLHAFGAQYNLTL